MRKTNRTLGYSEDASRLDVHVLNHMHALFIPQVSQKIMLMHNAEVTPK